MSTHRVILQQAKCFAWDDAKNAKLRKERGIAFEDIVFHIERAPTCSTSGVPER